MMLRIGSTLDEAQQEISRAKENVVTANFIFITIPFVFFQDSGER